MRSRVLSLLQQTDVTAEALDAAAVEAALSLCEENGHALPGAWEPAGVRRPPSHRSGPEGKTAASGVQGATSASLSSPRDSRGSGLAAGPRALPHASSSSSRSSKRSERCRPGAPRETGASARRKSHISLDVALRRESDRWAQRRPGKAHRGTHTDASTRLFTCFGSHLNCVLHKRVLLMIPLHYLCRLGIRR